MFAPRPETRPANRSGQAHSCFFPFASANIRGDDGFSRVFAHCEVESFVELMLHRIFRPGLDSEREAIRHAEKKQRKQKRRDFFYQDGLSGSGPLG